MKGKLLKNKKYISFMIEKGIRLDSIFIVDSISNKKTIVYLS